MKRVILLFFILSSLFINGFSQEKNKALTHTIKKGETVSSLAKLYKVTTRDILAANGLTDKSILKIGQSIIIPKATAPKTENKETGTASNVLKPNSNQHLIASGETLSKIARKYNVTEKQLMEWNNLSNSNIRAGNLLYVSKPTAIKKQNVDDDKNAEKTEAVKPKVDDKKEVKPVVADIIPATNDTNKPIESKPVVNTIVKDINPDKLGKGVFGKEFGSTNNSVEGMCAVFKTIAGWHDTKYYILINGAENGTIVKVMANNKFIYAKVLGPLPDIKEDKNVVMRISNAGAAALGIAETKFLAKVEF